MQYLHNSTQQPFVQYIYLEPCKKKKKRKPLSHYMDVCFSFFNVMKGLVCLQVPRD